MMMMMKNKGNHEGYIPLFRRFLDNELWTEKRKFSKAEAWIDLMFMARYGKETEEIIDRGELIKIGYGEILTSIKTLAKKWHRSETWVRALLEHLESKRSIKKHIKKNRRTIIEVVKLGYFQELVKKRSTERLTEEAQKKHRKSHKNKDNKEKKDNILPKKVIRKKTYGNEEINLLIKFFKERLGLPMLDGSEKQNRRFCYLAMRKFGGADKVRLLINAAANSDFWATKISSFMDLYYKGVRIINETRSKGIGIIS